MPPASVLELLGGWTMLTRGTQILPSASIFGPGAISVPTVLPPYIVAAPEWPPGDTSSYVRPSGARQTRASRLAESSTGERGPWGDMCRWKGLAG